MCCEKDYLTGMPTDICNRYGLSKTLLTRRETIRLKHLMKTLFVYRIYTEDELNELFKMMQFEDLMQYIEFLTNQLRGTYKITRDFECESADEIVKADHCSFIDLLRMYKTAHPIVVVDFDRTITNRKFHPLYRWLSEEGFFIIINSANPNDEVITNYLTKYRLPAPRYIFACKGKKAKVVRLKSLAMKCIERPHFYIDDEDEYLLYGNLLNYQCYKYTSGGKILSRTLCMK